MKKKLALALVISLVMLITVATPVLAGGKSLLDKIITQGGGLTFTKKLTDAIVELMKDNFRKKTLIIRGRKWVKNLTWDKIAEQWNMLFKELIQN